MKKLLDSHKSYLFFILPLLVGLFFIWFKLDLRPLHHDESLNALYGLYYYLDPENLFYKYDPMLHGPMLYHLLPWLYHFLDESYETIRLIPAGIFSLIPLVLIPLLRPWLGARSIIPAALLISGPSYVYWAKFLRHDQLVFFMFLIMGISFHPRVRRFRTYLFIIPLILQFCIKENAYVHLLMWMGFIIFDYLIRRKDFFILSILNENKKALVSSLFIGLFIYIYYYSAGFKYSEGILDGLYRKSLAYWVNQHNIERIAGPFLTQFFTLAWYELPFLILLIISIFKVHWKESKLIKALPFIAFLFPALFHITYGHNIPESSLWSTLGKVKIGLDFYGFIPLIILSISGTAILIKERKSALAFFYYWTLASFFTYSFVGEKVPWLSLYILIPGIVFLGLYYQNLRSTILWPVVCISIAFNLFQSYQLNFVNPGSETEFISQVHTSREYEQLAQGLQQKLERNKGLNILAYKGNTWPLTWYLYKREGYYYNKMGKSLDSFDLVMDNYPTATKLESYETKVLPLRHWWVPDWNKMNWLNFIGYSFHHRPWNPTGSQKVTLFYRKLLFNF